MHELPAMTGFPWPEFRAKWQFINVYPMLYIITKYSWFNELFYLVLRDIVAEVPAATCPWTAINGNELCPYKYKIRRSNTAGMSCYLLCTFCRCLWCRNLSHWWQMHLVWGWYIPISWFFREWMHILSRGIHDDASWEHLLRCMLPWKQRGNQFQYRWSVLLWLTAFIRMFDNQHELKHKIKHYFFDSYFTENCPSGTEPNDTLGGCTVCLRGTYRTSGIQPSCTQCPDTYTTLYAGATGYELCRNEDEVAEMLFWVETASSKSLYLHEEFFKTYI